MTRHGMVHSAETREQARGDLIDRWDRDRQAAPDSSRIILTHTNAEVRELNEAARDRMREAGDLGEDVRVTVERGERSFAAGDRVMFLQNERGLGVKNGTLGTIEQVSAQSMTVRTDDGRSIAFDLKDYDRIDHGYAATIHKAQGMTVDRTHVLATPGMDAHGSYVALSRHRDGMDLHYGRDDFASQDRLVNTLSRDRAKDMATDYDDRPGAGLCRAARHHLPRPCRCRSCAGSCRNNARCGRDIIFSVREPVTARLAGKGNWQGKGKAGKAVAEAGRIDPEAALRRARRMALVRHAHAVDAVFNGAGCRGQGNPEQVEELVEARKAFDAVRPTAGRTPKRPMPRMRALPMRRDRARSIAPSAPCNWKPRCAPARAPRRPLRGTVPGPQADRRPPICGGQLFRLQAARAEMGNMAMSLERDPQMESLLEGRKKQLGISMDFDSGMRLGRQLALSHGLGRGRGIGL
jgi:hypothetical protein